MSIASPATVELVASRSNAAAKAEAGCIVCLHNARMVYGDIVALQDVTLEIPAGQHVALLGASGSGKTTLLGCLSGRLKPTSGEARCHGRIATIHQDLRLVKQRSALANVLHGAMSRQSLPRTLFRFPAAERKRAVELLHRVGLGDRMHMPIARLSGGEQQRVAIARALMQQPQVLLADEPVASLDNANARSIMRLLSELQHERRLTLVSVLHDCTLAETFADRILGMQEGRIVHDDRAKETPSMEDPARRGLRGFERFEVCHACEMLAAPPRKPDPAPPRARSRWPLALLVVAVLGLYAWCVSGLHITSRDVEGFFGNMASFAARLLPRSWSQLNAIDWPALGQSLVATLQMALLGTTAAVLLSLPLAAIAARNVGPAPLRSIARFLLNTVRSIPSIIWALLFVCAVGLGALAGVLALVAYSIGYLTKFFYEAFEAVDPGPPDALREIGAGGLQRFVHAVWPAAQAAVLSSCLFMLEYNVRAASVLGVVGAGGIGHELKLHVDYGNYHIVGAILLMVIAVVLVLDAISSRIRARLMRP